MHAVLWCVTSRNIYIFYIKDCFCNEIQIFVSPHYNGKDESSTTLKKVYYVTNKIVDVPILIELNITFFV